MMISLVALIVMAETGGTSADDLETRQGKSVPAEDRSGVTDIVSLDEPDLDESSGLAISRRRAKHFWSHNDSGGIAMLYAFDGRGRKSGRVNLKTEDPVDWEDMASFVDDGVPRLLIADCGDNNATRLSITVHLLDEPDPTTSSRRAADQTVRIVYPDGPRDCEAIAVDPDREQIVLVSKTVFPAAGVYVVPLPSRREKSSPRSLTAKRIGTLLLPMVTAIDIDQANGDLWVVSYFQAFCFKCRDRQQSLARQITLLPRSQELPRWRQIESVAVDAAHDIWVTSEGSPAPLGRLPQNHAGVRLQP